MQRIEKPQWQPFFDRVSAAIGAQSLDIDIVSPDGGPRTQAHRAALTGLSYDSKDDIFAVIGEDLEHNIAHPREIEVDGVAALRSVQVTDQSGARHLIRLHDPLLLPPPDKGVA